MSDFPDEISPDDHARRVALQAVEGYVELGLTDMAWEEIRRLPSAQQEHPLVQEATLALLMKEKQWPKAIAMAERLCRECPDMGPAFIHLAYCLHETGKTQEAIRCLRNGPQSLQGDALFHYNMGCYLAACNEMAQAHDFLTTSFAMDEKLRTYAKTDPDLAEYWRQRGRD